MRARAAPPSLRGRRPRAAAAAAAAASGARPRAPRVRACVRSARRPPRVRVPPLLGGPSGQVRQVRLTACVLLGDTHEKRAEEERREDGRGVGGGRARRRGPLSRVSEDGGARRSPGARLARRVPVAHSVRGRNSQPKTRGVCLGDTQTGGVGTAVLVLGGCGGHTPRACARIITILCAESAGPSRRAHRLDRRTWGAGSSPCLIVLQGTRSGETPEEREAPSDGPTRL